MKKIVLVISCLLVLTSCKNISSDVSEAVEEKLNNEKNQEIFDSHIAAWKNTFLKGFEQENLDLAMNLFADSLKWNNPEALMTEMKTKDQLAQAIQGYIDGFDNITFSNDVYFGGSHYSSTKPSSSPDAIRVFGEWNSIHTESKAEIAHKWMGVLWFNKDGKVHQFGDYFDVSGLNLQIQGNYSR
ncbi:MAG: hypothetical protein P8L83_00070 [Flavobacteriaceae bacterium]|nr:hypothetical protein [Flavobacteriaceae bacterium]